MTCHTVTINYLHLHYKLFIYHRINYDTLSEDLLAKSTQFCQNDNGANKILSMCSYYTVIDAVHTNIQTVQRGNYGNNHTTQ